MRLSNHLKNTAMTTMSARHAVLLVGCSIIYLPGCATIFSESRYPVTIDNAGASTYFMVHDKHARLVQSGVTPQQVTLEAKSNVFMPAKYKVTFAGEGNTTQTRELNANVDPWIAGNVLIGGVPGLVVDGVTGAMWKLPTRVEGHVPPQYAIRDQSRGELLARQEVQKHSPSASSEQGVRQAAATSADATTRLSR